ncbi:MAG: hypothetical protein PWP03_712 [Candidatus Woesearchaeota archaeon]|nr:hypothetical protein [Candidatus Woesearchaeota archaeon]MDN5328074.1 hypothetical protein [Candidatus Woesearchaeota archaeon]
MKELQLIDVINELSLNLGKLKRYALNSNLDGTLFNNLDIKAMFPVVEGPIKTYITNNRYFDNHFRTILAIEHDKIDPKNIGSIASEVSEIYVDWLCSQTDNLLKSIEALKDKYLSDLREYNLLKEKGKTDQKLEKKLEKEQSEFSIIWDIPNIPEKLYNLSNGIKQVENSNYETAYLSELLENISKNAESIEPLMKELYQLKEVKGMVTQINDVEKCFEKIHESINEKPEMFHLLGIFYFYFSKLKR